MDYSEIEEYLYLWPRRILSKAIVYLFISSKEEPW